MNRTETPIKDKETIRNNGMFYTPKIWVDYAHKMITDQLGENWKDEYVVWDNCCGSKNLTRDYRFKELYCSTLFDSELEIGARYNPEATTFQYDFLNDSEDKLPAGLLEAFKQNKKIVFLLNPPYATANNLEKNGTSKEGVAKTVVNEEMLKNNIGACSQNLYAQFLYRIFNIKQYYNLTNCYIGIFCPTLFLSGGSYEKFRNIFLTEFTFNKGIQFQASHFADVSDSWGISFSIWNSEVCQNRNEFEYSCMDLFEGEIKEIQKKNVYNIDRLTSSSDWVKEFIKKLKTEDAPQLSSGIVCKQTGRGKLVKNAIGYYVNVSNNVYKNATDVYIVSSCSSMAHGCSILPVNFDRVVSNFSARKLIESNWINSKDEYLAPNEQHPQFQEFVNDSIVYSLFHSSSNQSSLRQIDYKDKKWDIKNEFFWLSKKEIENLANENNLDYVYQDARTSKERFVYEKLQTITLSTEAQAVLDKATELLKKSFKYRELFSEDHPEYQLDKCWDAGWYQIKAMLKEYMKDDLKEFTKLYKALGDKMRPMVYKLGFLR